MVRTSRQYYEEWPDDMRRQDFPFVDGASRTDTSREITLSKEYFVDARLWAPVRGNRCFLRTIRIETEGLYVTLDDTSGELGQAFVPKTELATTEKLVFYGDFSSLLGWIKVGPAALSRIYDHPKGTYRFASQATELAPTAVSAIPQSGTTEIATPGGDSVTGDVFVVGCCGVRLRPGCDGDGVAVDVIGDPLARRDQCDDPEGTGKLLNPLRCIRVINVNLGGAEFKVQPIGGTIITTGSDRFSTNTIPVLERQEGDMDGENGERPAVEYTRYVKALRSPGPNGEFLALITGGG